MVRRANHSTPLGDSPKHEKAPEPAQQTGRQPGDARDDEEQLKENQHEFDVTEKDHRTGDMKRGHRGTFP